MYGSPHEPEAPRTDGRAERDGDEDGSTTLRASPDGDDDPRQEDPLDEPGYGHGV